MNVISGIILSELLKFGHHIEMVSLLSDGRLSGEMTWESFRELLNSKLGLRIYEWEVEAGNTLLIFVAANSNMGDVKKEIEYLSKELNEAERNNLFLDRN